MPTISQGLCRSDDRLYTCRHGRYAEGSKDRGAPLRVVVSYNDKTGHISKDI